MGSLVGQALSQLADLLARQRADVQLPQTWPQALGYAPWVGEVWVNLLSNALKYGGSPPRLELGGAPDGAQVRFWVRDNGEPLSEEERTARFRSVHAPAPGARRRTRSRPGHGAAHRVEARRHRGVTVRIGGGNEFSFTLPAMAARRAGLKSGSRNA